MALGMHPWRVGSLILVSCISIVFPLLTLSWLVQAHVVGCHTLLWHTARHVVHATVLPMLQGGLRG